MRNKSIIFAFGPARGGTTYLGSILDKWFDVGTGPEGTFIPKAFRLANRLGDLSNIKKRKIFAEYLSQVEMLEIIRKRYPQELQFDVSPNEILKRMKGDSPSDGIFAVFESVADYRNKKRVGNKNPEFWKYLPLLLDLFPETSYFLFIVRDGRDVAISLRNVSWGGQSIYEAAVEWRNMIHKVDQFKNNIAKDRLLTIKYENILQKPAEAMEQIGRFLGEDNQELEIKKEKFQLSMIENEKRVNFNKWKMQLTRKEVEIFEAIAGQELEQYGYETLQSRPTISTFEEVLFKFMQMIRLIRLNLYMFGRKLPQDSKNWRPSMFKRIFRPGAKEK